MSRSLPVIGCALSLLIMAGCGGGGGSSAAPNLSLQNDAKTLYAALTPALVRDADLEGYLKDIGNRLIRSAAERDPQRAPAATFHLASGNVMNVATIGWQNVYVTTALFQRCRNEDELAAMMAHGYAHVVLRHSDRKRSSKADGGQKELAPLQIVQDAKNMYSAAQEAEATRLAFEIYARAGWMPERFSSFYQTLINQGLETTGNRPTLAQRAQTPKQVQLPAASRDWLERPVADESHFAEYQVRGQRNLPSAERAQTLLAALPSCIFAQDQPEQVAAQTQVQTWLTPVRPDQVIVVPGENGSSPHRRR